MTTENVPKKQCTEPKKIGTHNGTFHCDEVLACFMLKQLPEFKNAEIVRTRDPALIDGCDIVVDVGGTYDHSKCRYDHHQRTFDNCMSTLNEDFKWVTKLSSAGLVYYHYGHRLVAKLLSAEVEDKVTEVVYKKVYENFVEEIDAIDNGVSMCESPKYSISTNLSSRVSHLNPKWNEENVDIEARFHKAMELVGAEMIDRVMYYGTSWWPARELVVKAINNRESVDPSGQIVSFGDDHCPWKEHLMTIEEEMGLAGHIKFVLFTDQNKQWRVQCVPVRSNSFENRLSLKEDWRGVRDEALSEKSGIPECIFVHAGGFIGGNKTYEGALKMAQLTLKAQ